MSGVATTEERHRKEEKILRQSEEMEAQYPRAT